MTENETTYEMRIATTVPPAISRLLSFVLDKHWDLDAWIALGDACNEKANALLASTSDDDHEDLKEHNNRIAARLREIGDLAHNLGYPEEQVPRF